MKLIHVLHSFVLAGALVSVPFDTANAAITDPTIKQAEVVLGYIEQQHWEPALEHAKKLKNTFLR